MIQNVYAILDMKGQIFGPPHTIDCDANAIRSIDQMVNDPNAKTNVGLYPEDHQLYCIGSYDFDTGRVKSVEPRLVVHAISLKKEKKDEKN